MINESNQTMERPYDAIVVGGGASSQDLLALAIENGATDIRWVYRKTAKWFVPTRKAKQEAWPNLRELGLGQTLNGTRFASRLMNSFLRRRYRRFGISELIPDEPFDFDRHRSEVRRIEGKELILANGERFETDQLLWATGFRMNLHYLGLPEYSRIHRLAGLLPRLGSLIRSLDYPNLYFLGMPLIDRANYPRFWRLKYIWLAVWYAILQNRGFRVSFS